MGKSFWGSGCVPHNQESTKAAEAFWGQGMAPHPFSRAAQGVLCACVCGGYRWHQTLGAAGKEADCAKARTRARTRGRPQCLAHPSYHCAFLQPVQSHPHYRAGPEEHPSSFSAVRAAARQGHVDCFVCGLFLALGLLAGMLRDQSHTQPPVS